jgi:hypothetical protein
MLKSKRTALALAAAMAFMNCGGQVKYLIQNDNLGGRNWKSLLVPTQSVTTGVGANKQTVQLFEYQERVCDIDNAGVESNCATSTILENVVNSAQ